MSLARYTWLPVGLPELTVEFFPVGDECWEVRTLDGEPLGTVLRVSVTISRRKRFTVVKPWHWRFLNSDQNRGSHLRSRDEACSALLFQVKGSTARKADHA